MGRRKEGSVRPRGKKWLGSVPRLDDPEKPVECSFATEAAAWDWIRDQIARAKQGLEPEKPRRPSVARPPAERPRPQAPSAPALGPIARAWAAEHYGELENGEGDRHSAVLGDLEKHVIPAFDDLLGCDFTEGRNRIKAWLRAMAGHEPFTHTDRYGPAEKPYARDTVSGFLWILNQGLAFARAQGHDIPDYTWKLNALDPVGHQERPAPIVSLELTAKLAGHLHVIHQVVLWLLRLAGVRISEAYGFLVGHLIIDEDGNGYLPVKGQGGRPFRERDDDGHFQVVHRKEKGKTDAAYRLIALPGQLTALLQLVIAAYHTRPDGTVDVAARLIPPIRSMEGGQGGFRTALAAAARAVGGVSEDPDDYIIPHDLRKNYATDLAWNDDISGLLARRLLGHRAGRDVFDLVYTLDSRLKEHLLPGARALEQDIASCLESLVIPTAVRPCYGKKLGAERIAYADAQLEAAGWQVHDRGDLITTAEAARHLGMAETATRRLFPEVIPAVKGPQGWLISLDDVLAYRHRLDGHRFLLDLAEEADVDYHTAYRTMLRLEINPPKDAPSRTLLLTDADAARVIAELDRIKQLQARSMTVAAAAAALGTSHSAVNLWARTGRLAYDHEVDGAGSRYVTRASINDELARRGKNRPATVAVADLKAATGFDDAGIRALVANGHLVRARTGHLTVDSVRRWATGHRPDLLNARWLKA